ncbi:MAG: urea ABC transporter permease subunit UrtB [Rhodospirillaceae bacterium]|jgi:urea transport system permease protein|nr:urea ABC transporter permease subunit UrtB [Rhodospirillaceae bacterium]MBT7664730.1 urea ABC transporter permease subunit UrtB [Rhodospirillaceae bacterium]
MADKIKKQMAGFGLIAVLMCCVILPVASAAASDDISTKVQQLGARSYSAKIKAINTLAATGDERVAPILEAYLSRKLFRVKKDMKVVIAESSGDGFQLIDPLENSKLAIVKSSDIKKLRLNNRVRRAIWAALGGLTLASKDPAKRIKAAEAVYKAPKKLQIAILQKAVTAEQDQDVKRALTRALAAAELVHGSTTEIRVTAVQSLGTFADPDVMARLRGLLNKAGDGKFQEPDAIVRAAAESALSAIQEEVVLWDFLGKLFQGLSLASVLLLAAIGLAITFGVMGVINMAHGEMVMLGAYTTYLVQEVFRTYWPVGFDFSLAVAVPAAFVVAGAFGVAIERGIIRFLYGRPLETLLATWGLSLILQQIVRTIFGPTNKEVGNPSWMSGAIELKGGALLTYNRIWIIVFSLVVVALIALVLKKTSFGLQMRAVTQNRRMASAMGIKTGWVDAMTFGLGSGIAGMAGVALSQIDNVSPNLGQAYIVDSFMVVVFGGVGNLLGTLFGAVTLGVANKFIEAWSGAVLAKIFILVAVILFIQKRPRGLFALKGRAVES